MKNDDGFMKNIRRTVNESALRGLISLLPAYLLGFIFLFWFLQGTLTSQKPIQTFTEPSLIQLKKVEDEIVFLPLHVAGKGFRFQNKHARLKLKNGDTLLLQCYLYATEYPDKCFNFEYKGKTINHFNQLSFQEVTVRWLPVKNIETEGLIYQIEKNGKTIISFDNFVYKYKKQNNLQQKKQHNASKGLSAVLLLTFIFLIILIRQFISKI